MQTKTDARRVELHEKLCKLLGSKNVYFQPPESIRMKYPAIVYNLGSGNSRYADNKTYLYRKRYAVTVIEKNPDADWDTKMLNSFEYCNFERAYAADNLNHWQFSLYY
jgi:hypothetical protein